MTLLSSDSRYHVHHGDCIEHMASLPDQCFDFCVYSPPFPSTYAYTSLPEDLGNSEDVDQEARLHFSFFFRQIFRLIKPGRIMAVHCNQIIRMKRSGGEGVFDFRGMLIRLAERSGFIFDYDWCIRRNPQSQAIRTRSRELQFMGLESDRSKSRGAMPDYILKFRVPGENLVKIDSKGQVSRNEWIEWAECTWTGISETDTLNTKEAKSDNDVRHICALQLGTINRLVRLYSNPNELIFSPFCGIGSEGYEAVKLGRRFYGCEIKPEYYQTALQNLEKAVLISKESERTLFDMLGEPEEEKAESDMVV